MAYWLFQDSPKYYRIIDAIRDFEQMPWLVTRYGKGMVPGDGGLVWKSALDSRPHKGFNRRGLYSLGKLIERKPGIKED